MQGLGSSSFTQIFGKAQKERNKEESQETTTHAAPVPPFLLRGVSSLRIAQSVLSRLRVFL